MELNQVRTGIARLSSVSSTVSRETREIRRLRYWRLTISEKEMDNPKDDQKTKSTEDSKKVQIGSRSPAFKNTTESTKDKKKVRIGSRSPAFR